MPDFDYSNLREIDDTSPVKDAYFKVTLGKPCEFPINNISTEYPNG